jgi:hypothetical protein
MVDWIGPTISDAQGKVTYDGAFLTSLQLTRDSVAEIAACARARWKIQNESFNDLKNNGYHLEHNFGHGKENPRYDVLRNEPTGLRLPHRLRLPGRLVDQGARGKTRPRALLRTHENDHRLSGLPLVGNSYDDLNQIKAAPRNQKPDGQSKKAEPKRI